MKSSDIEELAGLQIRERDDCVACFSCNADDVWPFVTYGWTPPEFRWHVGGKLPLLDRIIGDYRQRRPAGGRIFVTLDGVYDWQRDDSKHKFVVFTYQVANSSTGHIEGRTL